MKTLIFGGMGLIGKAVARECKNRGQSVVIADRIGFRRCDIRERAAVANLISDVRPDAVYQFAGELGTSELDTDIPAAVESNILGMTNVFDACARFGVGLVFHPSKPSVWLNTYTVTKAANEEIAKLYNSLHQKTRITSLRYFNAHGGDQHLFPVRKLVPTLAAQAILRLPMEVFGDGLQTVDMIDVRDMARLTVDFCETGRTDCVPDCGSGEELTVLQVARDIARHFGRAATDIVHLPMRQGETPGTRLVANIHPLSPILGKKFYVSTWRETFRHTLEEIAALPRERLIEAAKFYGWKI
jgi:UDP-glucose 4-epimerase